MPKVSAEHRETRRAEILAAARRRFARDGFHATSMQDILDESGLSAGAVYTYFPGKNEIVSAIASESAATLLDTLSSCAENAELSVADIVVAAIRAVRARDAPQRTSRLALQVWAESTRDPRLRTQFGDTHASFRRVVAQIIRDRHPDRTDDADCMAGVVATLVPGFISQTALLDSSLSVDFECGVRLVLGDL